MNWKARAFLLFITAVVLILSFSHLQKPYEIRLSMEGSSTLVKIPNRATLSLEISTKGSNQGTVTDDVQKTTNEIITLLRPLKVPPNKTPTNATDAQGRIKADLPAPIASLSVNSFSSQSYPQDSFLGEKITYTSTITVTAEFRSIPPLIPSLDGIVDAAAGFHHLALVLPTLAKLPHTKITSLEWSISPEELTSLKAQARQNAMSEALIKAADFTAPLRLRFPIIRCQHLQGTGQYRPERFVRREDFDRHKRLQGRHTASYRLHDEADDYDYGYEIEQQMTGAFSLEPKSINIISDVLADFVVIERSLLRALIGYVL